MALNTYSSGDILSSSKVNADFTGLASGALMNYNASWTSFTPTWTASTSNPAIGNGTLRGYYLKIGRMIS